MNTTQNKWLKRAALYFLASIPLSVVLAIGGTIEALKMLGK